MQQATGSTSGAPYSRVGSARASAVGASASGSPILTSQELMMALDHRKDLSSAPLPAPIVDTGKLTAVPALEMMSPAAPPPKGLPPASPMPPALQEAGAAAEEEASSS